MMRLRRAYRDRASSVRFSRVRRVREAGFNVRGETACLLGRLTALMTSSPPPLG
jgi:hypothetical protein